MHGKNPPITFGKYQLMNGHKTSPIACSASHDQIRSSFQDFILNEDHPCVMAQTVFSLDQVDFHTYEGFGTKATANELLKDLKTYLSNYSFESKDFRTFIAAFKGGPEFSEAEFEKTLWEQLQHLHEADDARWDEKVSADAENQNFSFSLAGRAFYVVGMHPNSSRKARQCPVPAIAFNLHWQFEKLREMGSFQAVRDKIRERDIALQGGRNPMLEDFGMRSEAPQYSGRKVGEDWKCPFLHHKK